MTRIRNTETYSLITGPTVEPVTSDEFKAHARIDTTADDTLIAALLKSARMRFESQCNVYPLSQDWRLTMDRWPGVSNDVWWDGVREGSVDDMFGARDATVVLEKRPFISLTDIKMLAEDATETTVSSTTYYTSPHIAGQQVTPDDSWPGPTRVKGGIQINFKVGYGTTADDVPEDIKHAIMMIASHWYENREAVDGMQNVAMSPVPMGAAAIMRSYKLLTAL